MSQKTISKWYCFHSSPLQWATSLHLKLAIPVSLNLSFSSSIGHTHPCTAFTNSVHEWAADTVDTSVSPFNFTCQSNLIFIASGSLSLNDFDASLLHRKVKILFVPSSWDLQLHWLFPFRPFYAATLNPKETHEVKGIGGITLLSSSTLLP